jgi:hypothetical protein
VQSSSGPRRPKFRPPFAPSSCFVAVLGETVARTHSSFAVVVVVDVADRNKERFFARVFFFTIFDLRSDEITR